MGKKSVKILFRFYSDILESWTVETLWAEIVNADKGLYKLDNIPFYASVFCEDIVYAEFDTDEEMLTYRKTIEHSGNSTIQVIVTEKNMDAQELRDQLKSLGCDSEKYSKNYFVLMIPKNVDYKPIREILSDLEKQEKIGYAEPNLAENHCY